MALPFSMSPKKTALLLRIVITPTVVPVWPKTRQCSERLPFQIRPKPWVIEVQLGQILSLGLALTSDPFQAIAVHLNQRQVLERRYASANDRNGGQTGLLRLSGLITRWAGEDGLSLRLHPFLRPHPLAG